MKNKSLFVSLFILCACTTAIAQQKYGHINSVDILEAMPEYKQMTATLDKKKKDAQMQMQKMYQDYQAKLKEINDFGSSMMEAVREERLKEIDSLQRSLSTFEERAGSDIQKMQSKLMKPLNDKYLKIVQAVAKENGYAYIFDVASGGLAYYPENTGDVTDQVKKKMGIN